MSQAESIQTQVDLNTIAKDKDIQPLFSDARRKLVRVILRNGAVLDDHSAVVPITIHCLQGSGVLRVGEQRLALTPGVLVPLDAKVVHAVEGHPEIVILLTLFRAPG